MKRGIGSAIVEIGSGLLGIVATLIERARKPKRADEILREPLGVEALREAAGRSMVGDEPFPPPPRVPRELSRDPGELP